MTRLFADVPADERAAMVGGTLGGLLGFTTPVAATANRTRAPSSDQQHRRAGWE